MLVAACDDAPARKKPRPEGVPVLRVLYRDADMTLLMTLPAQKGGPRPPESCTAPLLIDPVTGAARAISREEAAVRLKTMEMSGATSGRCQPG